MTINFGTILTNFRWSKRELFVGKPTLKKELCLIAKDTIAQIVYLIGGSSNFRSHLLMAPVSSVFHIAVTVYLTILMRASQHNLGLYLGIYTMDFILPKMACTLSRAGFKHTQLLRPLSHHGWIIKINFLLLLKFVPLIPGC